MVMEKKLTISLDEIKTVRLLCNIGGCQGVVELPVNRLIGMTQTPECPACGRRFQVRRLAHLGDHYSLALLGTALQDLASEGDYSVEIVLPAPCE